MSTGIYRIYFKENSKVYVGSAVDITKRIRSHKNMLLHGKHHCIGLQRAFNKYGNFKWKVIDQCSTDNLIYREQIYIDWYKEWRLLYNAAFKANSVKGIKWSKEQRNKHSERIKNMYLDTTKRNNILNSHKPYFDSIRTDAKKNRKSRNKVILIYNNGNCYIEYPTCRKAAFELKTSEDMIARSCLLESALVNNCMVFMFKKDYSTEAYIIKIQKSITNKGNGICRKVIKLEYTTNSVLNIYNSLSLAAADNKVALGNLSKACNGKLTSLGGFKWKYA